MTIASSVLLWCLWFQTLDQPTPIPEPVIVKTRMLLLKEGMDATQVESVLRLGRRFPFIDFTVRWSSTTYQISSGHTLTLEYRNSLLTKATLYRGKDVVARMPRKKNPGPKVQGIDPTLIDAAIRAVQERAAK